MNYYLYDEYKKTLTDPLTEIEANERFKKLKEITREHFRIVHFPEIREGLKLYVGDKYYKTIVGSSDVVWFLNYTQDKKAEDIDDAFTKENLIKRFVNGVFNCDKEIYEDNIDFVHVDTVHIEGQDTLYEEE